jgi:alpha-L-fucosidase
MIMRHLFLLILTIYALAIGNMSAQDIDAQPIIGFTHEQSAATDYQYPTDPAVRQKLSQWQDLKFGVLFHWGLYSVPGIVESWSICSEDVDWISRRDDIPYDQYKQWYFGLKDKFNPQWFNPKHWAEVMADAGMKYMIFTSKHHDGFCMYDSQYTDFSIANGAFKEDPQRDVARYVWEAFRDKGFMTGCYFSKPDWHCPWFWNDHFATSDRNINYDKATHPEWWENYRRYTRNQIEELTTNYGPLDILWLDGGWISGSDIDLDDILKGVRQRQPGLIAVDRCSRDHNENYQTPERGIPDKQLNYPWESCIPLSNDWGWVPNAPYKSANRVLNTLIEVTAKGGCLLLGIGPDANGVIEPDIEIRLHTVGEWLRRCGKAIYSTHTTPIYNDGKVWFTADKDGETLYAIYTEEDDASLPKEISWHGNIPKGVMTMLNSSTTVRYTVTNGKVTVRVPKHLANEPLAIKFKIK